MGWIHYLAYQRSSKAMLDAFCSRNQEKRSGDWTSIKGNFGPPGEKIPLAGLKVYSELDEILTDPDIDLVDICLPPHMHVEAACKSLRAGKHVLCEKPLGLTTEDCDTILAAAEESGKQVLVAQVLPFMGEFQYAYQSHLKSEFGAPRRAFFKRAISPPDWIPDLYESEKVGGPLVDLHVHDTHFVRMLFGMPQRVMCSAEMRDGIVKYCYTLMEFDEAGLIVGTSSGVSDQNGRPFCHGFEIQFSKAAIPFELAALLIRIRGFKRRINRRLFGAQTARFGEALHDGGGHARASTQLRGAGGALLHRVQNGAARRGQPDEGLACWVRERLSG